jgi:riboflavin synthase
MFTGLIETTGMVLCVTLRAGVTRITIGAEASLVSRLSTGDSVAVNGVCLTALDIEPHAFPPRFSADLAVETIARTTLSRLKPDTVVNLELPTPAGSPLGGHVVQGHVDGTATLIALEAVAPDTEITDYRLCLSVPDTLTRYIVEKGSITVEGISLTVARVQEDQIEIAIIPHTYSATNLRMLSPGDEVNVEVDVLGKYADRQGDAANGFALTEKYLIANGY